MLFKVYRRRAVYCVSEHRVISVFRWLNLVQLNI